MYYDTQETGLKGPHLFSWRWLRGWRVTSGSTMTVRVPAWQKLRSGTAGDC